MLSAADCLCVIAVGCMCMASERYDGMNSRTKCMLSCCSASKLGPTLKLYAAVPCCIDISAAMAKSSAMNRSIRGWQPGLRHFEEEFVTGNNAGERAHMHGGCMRMWVSHINPRHEFVSGLWLRFAHYACGQLAYCDVEDVVATTPWMPDLQPSGSMNAADDI